MASLPIPSTRILTPMRRAALLAIGAGLGAGLIVLGVVGDLMLAAGFLGAGLLLFAALLGYRLLASPAAPHEAETDWSIAQALAEASADAVAVTDRAGRLVCANRRYATLFAGLPTPPNLPIGEAGVSALANAGRAAWRDGHGTIDRIVVAGTPVSALIERSGQGEDSLVWRFRGAEGMDLVDSIEAMIAGGVGNRMASAGIMIVLITADGRIRAANRVFRTRAMGHEEGAIAGRDFAGFLITDGAGHIRFEQEGVAGNALRVVQIPFVEGDQAPMLVALLDEEDQAAARSGAAGGGDVHGLVALMPFGIALVDREGRFVQMNDAFVRATEVDRAAPPLYPGDLVVREDKAAVADAIRRFALGATHSMDMAVRLKGRPDEPVALSIAGARGLGEAAVLISLKDNGEETRLKREVAQATKMQAVGQLAGGVAHDFNNVLTAIIGTCDLMLLRHIPGDSDYDDIQQIRANSNRAASLTRQLLAFSRQQTLRPEIIQLPDVVSEVSPLIKRLLGEKITFYVQHDRNLGPVRADPQQLEQVIMNLAVNARDAIQGNGGPARGDGRGRISLFTRALQAKQVVQLGSEVLPAADYTVLIVQDTGGGIPPHVLPKLFEPFFTTKEQGRGTGLGLSTAYGIVKQSGGFIFADNVTDKSGHPVGARFTVYLPVHHGEMPKKREAVPLASSAGRRAARCCWSRTRTWSAPSPSAP